MRSAVIPTTEYIQSLYNEGNIAELRRLNEQLGKRSNERMRQLEKRGFDGTAAYKRAESFLDKSEYAKNNRFSRSKKIDEKALLDQVKQEANFLRWQTSTVAGELKRREKIFDTLTSQRINPVTGEIEEPVIDIPSNMSTNAFKKKFMEFLDSNAWDEIKKHMYQSNILNEAGEAISAGASVEELKEAVHAYMDGESEFDLIEIWDNWTKVEK